MAPPSVQWFDSTDVTLQTAAITGTLAAGSTIAAVQYDLWNDKGGVLGSTTLKNARIVAEGFDGTNWVRSGLPWLDEGWLQISLVGQNNVGDATMAAQTTAFTPLGTNRSLLINDIPKNCARYVSAKIVGPSGLSTLSADMRMVVVYDDNSLALGLLTSLASGSGVIPDRWISGLRKFSRSVGISATGLATVTVSERFYTYDGLPYLAVPQIVTLNQTSGSGALTVGNSYITTLSQAVGTNNVTTTKSNQAASPIAPATPTNEIFIGRVTVVYQAGGTSVINTGNVDTTGQAVGEYYVRIGSGLNLIVAAGTAITVADTEVFNTSETTVAIGPSITFYLWLLADGTFTYTTTVSSPSVGAIILATGSTTGSVIANLIPAITTVGRAIDTYNMTLRYKGPLTVATDLDWDCLPWVNAGTTLSANAEWALDRIFCDFGTPPGSSATILDVKFRTRSGPLSGAGTTIFTSQGAGYDKRINTSGTLAASSKDPAGGAFTFGNTSFEVRTFNGGDRISFDVASVDAVPGTDVSLQLQFRRLR